MKIYDPGHIFESFAHASHYAKELAIEMQSEMKIIRVQDGWEVSMPAEALEIINSILLDEAETRRKADEDRFDRSCEPDPRWSENERIRDEEDFLQDYDTDTDWT